MDPVIKTGVPTHGAKSCQLLDYLSTRIFQYHDASSMSPCGREQYFWSCVTTQHVSFERYMGVINKYVHNHSCLEASIAKGYETEDVIEFCVEFIEDLRPVGVPESSHEGRHGERGLLEGKQ